ncbi:hypothetical protein GJ744_010243 [Endocarpon pusillum]|uniref:Uncharacterized protein n=1 Tax=Endocarpon pusillum TaxID=364733 RepID=A0A8H7AEL9_9EURO|nr:hypothetical protein GJ744_010243 [Endocarpon pusillum]
MPSFSLLSLFSLLISDVVSGHAGDATALPRAPQTTFVPAQYRNSTTTSATFPTITDAAHCTGCQYGEPGLRVRFEWPFIWFPVTELVLATVIYKVGPNNVTSTMTRYNNDTLPEGVYSTFGAKEWNARLHTTGVTMENGTPHFLYVTTIYSAPNSPMTVSTVLTSPTSYENWGWIFYTANSTYGTSGCTIQEKELFALTPTATPAGYTSPYEAPHNWSDLIPSSVKEKCHHFVFSLVEPMEAVWTVSALTATSTEFDDEPETLIDPVAKPSRPAEVSSEAQAKGSGSPLHARPPSQSPPPSQALHPHRPSTITGPSTLTGPPPSQVPPPSQASPFQPPPLSEPPSNQGARPSLTLPPSAAPVGSETPNQSPSSPPGIVIGTQILTPGSSAIAVSGIPFLLGSDYPPAPSSAANLGSLIEFGLGGTQTPTPALPPVATPAPPIVVGSQTLTPGGFAITVSGTPISLASIPTAIVIGTNTIPVSQTFTHTSPPASNPTEVLVIDNQVLTPGAPAVTISDTPVSPASVPTAIVVGTNTISVNQASPPTAIVIGTDTIPVSQAFTPTSPPISNPTGVLVIDNQTLTPGAPAVIISDTPVSLASVPTAIAVGTNTIPVNQASPPTAIVIGTNTIPVSRVSTPTSGVGPGPLVIDSQTLTPGGPAVATLSDGQTVSFAQSSTALVIGSHTILPGAPGVTISGIEYSLASSATAFVVNGETVGSVVTVGTRTASGSSPAVYTGAARRILSVPTNWQRVMALLLWGGLLLLTS